jgi:hypothetical protein
MTKRTKITWAATSFGNMILEGDGFFISFRPSSSRMPLVCFDPDTDQGETCLALAKKGEAIEYYILNGDFRKEYEAVFDQGLQECMVVYATLQVEHRSTWSNDNLTELKGKSADEQFKWVKDWIERRLSGSRRIQ